MHDRDNSTDFNKCTPYPVFIEEKDAELKAREYSMVAGARVKKEGLDNNLCELILNDPMFMITKEEMDKIMKPENFIGRCPQQVDEFIENCVKPVVEANGVSDDVAEINV